MQTALAGQSVLADADTGLIHQGGGRFYDPTLGRPLQPNPFGGLPTVPQSLNRYAATSMGAPGVAEATVNGGNLLTNVALTALSNTSGAIASDLARVTVQPVIRGTKTALLNAQRNPQVRAAIGDNVAKRIRQTLAGKTNAQLGIARREVLEFAFGTPQLVRPGETVEGGLIGEFNRATLSIDEGFVGLRGFIAKHPLAIGIGIDVGVSALFEINAPYWSNPYLSGGQKAGQFFVNLTFAGIASGATFYTVSAIGVTNPVGIVTITIGVGTLYVFGFGEVAHSIIEGSGLNVENRQLQPLEGVP